MEKYKVALLVERVKVLKVSGNSTDDAFDEVQRLYNEGKIRTTHLNRVEMVVYDGNNQICDERVVME